MITWTAKAETDYRGKWPGMPCKRIAGREAKYQGRAILPGSSVYQAYAMRGWVANDGKSVKMAEPQNSAHFGISHNGLPLEDQLKRWVKIQRFCREDPQITIQQIASNLGLKCYQSIPQFVERYGRDLVAKLGKIPRVEGKAFRKGIWLEIMEQ